MEIKSDLYDYKKGRYILKPHLRNQMECHDSNIMKKENDTTENVEELTVLTNVDSKGKSVESITSPCPYSTRPSTVPSLSFFDKTSLV